MDTTKQNPNKTSAKPKLTSEQVTANLKKRAEELHRAGNTSSVKTAGQKSAALGKMCASLRKSILSVGLDRIVMNRTKQVSEAAVKELYTRLYNIAIDSINFVEQEYPDFKEE